MTEQQLILVEYFHRHGHDTYLCRFQPAEDCACPTDEMLIDQLDLDFEEDREDEWIDVKLIKDPSKWPLIDAALTPIEDDSDEEEELA